MAPCPSTARTLQKMLTTYPSDVEAMFMTTQSSSDPGVIITNTAGAALSGVYNVTGITTAIGGQRDRQHQRCADECIELEPHGGPGQ